MKLQIFALLQCALLAAAWMPKDNGYFNKNKGNTTTSSNTTIVNNHRSFKHRRSVATIPSFEIRGVNLGSLFIIEPWMASTEWANMGCGSAFSEFDCVLALGQTKANEVWANHWATWITQEDITTMVSYGLNTIRIPVGYWMFEGLVYSDSEYFPQGGLPYLQQVCQWATDAGMYIIIDLHGAPGAQVAEQPFTGQYAPTAGFYQDYQYQRAYWFLGNMTEQIFSVAPAAYKGVGMIEVVNEPISGESTLISEYYPNALAAVRNVETALGIAEADKLNIQMMDERWGSGNPDADLTDLDLCAYDDHSYLKYDTSVAANQDSYLTAACELGSTIGTNWPEVVGEWSISPNDQNDSDLTNDSANIPFYTNWWSAQVQAYETQDGWVFWSWKTNLGDYRWDYQLAVQSGVIPTNIDDAYNFNCAAYTKK